MKVAVTVEISEDDRMAIGYAIKSSGGSKDADVMGHRPHRIEIEAFCRLIIQGKLQSVQRKYFTAKLKAMENQG